MAAPTRIVSFWVGTVPGTKYSVIFLVVYGPGWRPVKASTSAVSMSAGRLEGGDRLALADLGQDGRPERRRRVERQLPVVGGVVAVAHPDADREGRCLLVVGRGEIAVGRHVPVVAGRAGLVGRRPARLAVVDRPLAPERVDLLVRVAGQDVGDDERGLRAQDLLALGLLVGQRPDRPPAVDDRADEPAGHLDAAVGDRPVGAEQVDRVDLERPDAHRQDRHRGLRVAAGRSPSSGRRRDPGRS